MYTKNLDWNKYGRFSVVTSFDDDLDFAKCTKENNGTNWRDYNENTIADGATALCCAYRLSTTYEDYTGADSATWQKVTISFTTTEATRYMIVIANIDLIDTSNAYMWISDLDITANSTDSDEKESPVDWKSPVTWTIITANDKSATAAVDGPVTAIKNAQSQTVYSRVTLETGRTYTFTMYTRNGTIGSGAKPRVITSFGDDALDFAKCYCSSGMWEFITMGDGAPWWDRYEAPDGATVVQGEDISATANIPVTGEDGNEWYKTTFTFTTTSTDTEYLIVFDQLQATGDTMYISDVSIEKEPISQDVLADVDGDGEVSVKDVIVLAKLAAGWTGVSYVESRIDPNGDVVTDLSNSVHLSRYIAGWEGIEIYNPDNDLSE